MPATVTAKRWAYCLHSIVFLFLSSPSQVVTRLCYVGWFDRAFRDIRFPTACSAPFFFARMRQLVRESDSTHMDLQLCLKDIAFRHGKTLGLLSAFHCLPFPFRPKSFPDLVLAPSQGLTWLRLQVKGDLALAPSQVVTWFLFLIAGSGSACFKVLGPWL